MQTLYDDIIQKLERRGLMPERPPGIQLTQEALSRFDFDIDPKKVVLVAGTNGKGSVCAGLESLLSNAGKTVGLFTSPHLIDTTERIRINGVDLTKASFCESFDLVRDKTKDLNLSHFEMLTVMAVERFINAEVEWMIFEVGLGGTWDSTNAIPHSNAVITSLGMDHQKLLGNTLTEIAKNKFGIIPKQGLVVHHPFPDEIQNLSKNYQENLGGRWVVPEPAGFNVSKKNSKAPEFTIQSRWGEVSSPLPGKRGAENFNLALTTFEALGFDSKQHLSAISKVRWSGRMEKIGPVYLSGDHNKEGIQSLIDLLQYYDRDHLHILAGVGKEKDIDGILEPLFSLPNASVYLTETTFQNKPLEEYGEWLKRACLVDKNSTSLLYKILKRAKPQDMVLVTGSLYLVGHIKEVLTQ